MTLQALSPEPTALVLLLAVGTWSALDGTSVGQVMISRPLVAGVLAGAVLGDPALGLLVGGILEAVYLVDVPAGGTTLPEPGPAAVPAVMAAAAVGAPGGLALGVALGVCFAWLGGGTMVWMRRLNERIAGHLAEEPVSAGEVAVRHWLCVAGDALRGAALTAGGLAVALHLPPALALRWPFSPEATVALLLVPAALGAGVLFRAWGRDVPGGALFAAGIGGGILLALAVGI